MEKNLEYGYKVAIDRECHNWKLLHDEEVVELGNYAVKEDRVVVLQRGAKIMTIYDDDVPDNFCDHENEHFGDEDEKGYCPICGASCNWYWETEYDDELGEIKSRHTEWEIDEDRPCLRTVLYDLYLANE